MVTEAKRTITSIFMVPTLKVPKNALKNNGFLNGYIKDAINEQPYENCIYLLFRPEQVDMFREFLDSEYERTKSVIDDYDHPNGFVVVVYKLNEKYAADFALVKRGMYSKTSPEFQNEFPKTTVITLNGYTREEISLQYRVFHRTSEMIKYWEDKFGVDLDDNVEVWRGFDEEDETLTEEKLREYEQGE